METSQWFYRTGTVKKVWKPTFLLRDGNDLFWYKDDTMSDVIGKVALNSVEVLPPAESKGGKGEVFTELTIREKKEKTVFRTANPVVADDWYKNLTCGAMIVHMILGMRRLDDAALAPVEKGKEKKKQSLLMRSPCTGAIVWIENQKDGDCMCSKLVLNRRFLDMPKVDHTLEFYNKAFINAEGNYVNHLFVRPEFRMVGHVETTIPFTENPKVILNYRREFPNALYPMKLIQHWALQLVVGLRDFHRSGLYAFTQILPSHIVVRKGGWLLLASTDVLRVDTCERPIQEEMFIKEYAPPEIRETSLFSQEGNWWNIGVILHQIAFGFTVRDQGGFEETKESACKSAPHEADLMARFVTMVGKLLQDDVLERGNYVHYDIINDPFFDEFTDGDKANIRLHRGVSALEWAGVDE